jgi:hypothetical protein
VGTAFGSGRSSSNSTCHGRSAAYFRVLAARQLEFRSHACERAV